MHAQHATRRYVREWGPRDAAGSADVSGDSKGAAEALMDNLFFATDGTASALASVKLYELGYLGVVRFVVDSSGEGALRHECIRHRDTREEALGDARSDALRLVTMWVEDRVRLGGL